MTIAPRLLALLAGLGLAATTAWAAPGHTTPKSSSHQTATKTGEVWNWAEIDTNKDNLIEPDEMTAFLGSHPGVQKKSG